VPEEVTLITAGVDVQADRLEIEFVGWGPGEESWSLDYYRIPGDPSVQDVWQELDQQLGRRWKHPEGYRIPVAATCVDSGYLTQQVYKFCKPRQNARVWAIKGVSGTDRPIMDRPHRKTRKKVPLYPVGVDSAKMAIYQRLQIEEPGDGYCHFPRRDPYDEEYFRQLTSEKLVRKTDRRGYPKLQWVRRPNRRAEALDVRVYALAALEGLLAAGVKLDPEHRRRKRGRRRVRSKGLDA
jgi:phage terminase large subunit GpA-like protein